MGALRALVRGLLAAGGVEFFFPSGEETCYTSIPGWMAPGGSRPRALLWHDFLADVAMWAWNVRLIEVRA